MSDVTVRNTYEKLLAGWWLLVLLMVAGGGLGWLGGRLLAPVYDASAVYDVNLDEALVIIRDQIEPAGQPIDSSIKSSYTFPVEAMFTDPEVEAALLSGSQELGIALTGEQINARSFIVDRRGAEWYITVRSEDALTAARLANLWLTITDARLREAQGHSVQMLALQAERDTLVGCSENRDLASANQCAGTSFATASELGAYLSELQQHLDEEQLAGRAIDPALSFQILSLAEPPEQPTLYAVSLLMVAGSLIGLLAGFLLVQVLPHRSR